MKNVEIKRLYKEKIDIRNYVLNECMEKKEDIRVTVENEPGYMILKHTEFRQKHTGISKKEFQSQHDPNQKYRLVSFKWEPIK